MVKCTGAEWDEFYKDPEFWPKDWYHEDESFNINGKYTEEAPEGLNPTDKVEILSGIVYPAGGMGVDSVELTSHYTRWKKARKDSTLVIQFPKDLEPKVRELLKSLAIKVLQ